MIKSRSEWVSEREVKSGAQLTEISICDCNIWCDECEKYIYNRREWTFNWSLLKMHLTHMFVCKYLLLLQAIFCRSLCVNSRESKKWKKPELLHKMRCCCCCCSFFKRVRLNKPSSIIFVLKLRLDFTFLTPLFLLLDDHWSERVTTCKWILMRIIIQKFFS